LYAVVAGSLPPLLTHDFLDHHAHSVSARRYEFLAFLAGVALVVILSVSAPDLHAAETLAAGAHAHHGGTTPPANLGSSFIDAFVILVRETSPYLLLGLIISGLLQAYMPASPIAWMRRGGPLLQSVKGMAFGLPLPICSCGVLPLFLGLARRGVPPACLVAFLIATPELGVDSFLLSVKLLGWKFSTVRLIVTALLPVVIALVAVRFLPTEALTAEPASCCAKNPGAEKLESRWHFAFVSLTDDIFPFVFFGLCIAALAQILWPASDFPQWVGGWDILILGLIGIPFYVCASASVPFALVLLQHGFSIGSVVVFLFAGPATNVATILTVNKAFGGRSGLILAAIAFVAAVATGFAINGLYQPDTLDVLQLHQHEWSLWDYAAFTGILLLGLMSLYRSGPLHWFSTVAALVPGVIHHPPESRGDCH